MQTPGFRKFVPSQGRIPKPTTLERRASPYLSAWITKEKGFLLAQSRERRIVFQWVNESDPFTKDEFENEALLMQRRSKATYSFGENYSPEFPDSEV
ncbi:hypothetical protein AV530_016802 [Patagioenas fasciata monilis]|uniref:Uncharacterized protein n=1 Tax=Patagioenas fasciata monilis TaxID=372326 RepID=A0A1V4J3M8_PATFA|nr:hypothetical protein AV530_016802 [Patagioenas fasciata monilis]